MKSPRKRFPRPLLLLALALGIVAAPPAAASAAPLWDIKSTHGPTNFQPGESAEYVFYVHNLGDAVSPDVTMEIDLPPGVTTRMHKKIYHYSPEGEESSWFGEAASTEGTWNCGPPAAGQSSLTCTAAASSLPVRVGAPYLGRLVVYVDVPADADGSLTATATVSGGGAQTTRAETAPVGPPVERFGIAPGSFAADAVDVEGQPERRAGIHPYRAYGTFAFNRRNVSEQTTFESGVFHTVSSAIGSPRNVELRLPRGFVGNPRVLDSCDPVDMATFTPLCPATSQVGTVEVTQANHFYGPGDIPATFQVAVYNITPPQGVLARFGFQVANRPVYVDAILDPRDYSVVTRVANINSTVPVHFQQLTLWGVPGDPAHDAERAIPGATPGPNGFGAGFDAPVRPFLSLPTECNVPDTTDLIRLNSWAEPDVNVAEGIKSEPAILNGCDQLEFAPTIVVRPTTNLADSPAGLEFEMNIPQNEDVENLATAHLRDAVVKLPAGMTVNPPSAAGLDACSMAEVGIGSDAVPNGEPVRCPEASKLGTVEAESPPIDHPMHGTIYLAEQNANPFNTMIAMYLVLEDPETGLLVKLPGKAEADQTTGQLTATFENNPQLPVENLRLKFFEGPRAALKTPSTCGTYETTGTLTPWSAPEAPSVGVSSSFELTQGPGGGACLPGGGSAPNKPTFSAGTIDPTAKAFTPFGLKLTRADGNQQLSKIETTLPKGLVAKLAGTTYCSDAALASAAGKSGQAEKASASCPASSRVGSVNVGAGAGSTPLYVSGEAYLAGPYKGAPLSLAIVTPAVAGPFDLGTVVVRTALHVNSETAQVKATSDELPQILQGIPLNIRSIALKMDRPQFILNPTSCDPMSVDASALTVFNQSAALTNHFQVGECNKLGFKPKLAMSFSGKTTRSGHPALKAVLTARPGDANIARAEVTLPKTEFLAQDHIRTICTRVQYAAKTCPKGAVYGYAKAWTPLLDQPLEGPVYLRSSSNKLPDLVADLNGQLEVDLVGRIDSPKAMIRNTFELVPDAPVSKFVLTMQGGKKGLLVNNSNLCRQQPRLEATFEAQNGKTAELTPLVKTDCGKKGRKGKGKKRGGK